MWVGAARLLCHVSVAIGVAVGFLARSVRTFVGCVWRLWSCSLRVWCSVAGFHVGVRGKAAGRVVQCSAKTGACKLMGAGGEQTPHFASLAEGEAFLAERDNIDRSGFVSPTSGSGAIGASVGDGAGGYPTAGELSARQMRALTDPMRDALEAYSSSAALDVNKYLKQPDGGVLFDEGDDAFADMMADLAGDPDFGGFDDDFGDLFFEDESGAGLWNSDRGGESGAVSLREEIDAGGLTVQKADRVIALMDEAFAVAPERVDADRPLYRGVQARVNYSGVHSTGGRSRARLWVTWWSSLSFCLRPRALRLLTILVTVWWRVDGDGDSHATGVAYGGRVCASGRG